MTYLKYKKIAFLEDNSLKNGSQKAALQISKSKSSRSPLVNGWLVYYLHDLNDNRSEDEESRG
jgi:hypothetical protein